MSITSIAIIGAGFSGMVSIYELFRQVHAPLQVLLFDQRSTWGIAYATNCPLHLLNVSANKMGAFADRPEHFYDWLLATKEWRKLDPSFAAMPVEPDAYFPRMIYAKYLDHAWGEIQQLIVEKGGKFIRVQENATDVKKQGEEYLITSQSGQSYVAQKVILAVSSPWTQPIPHQKTPYYLSTPWPTLTDMHAAKKLLNDLGNTAHVGIIGSGLTMLDTLATLRYCNFPGLITVITRKCLLPLPHIEITNESQLVIDTQELGNNVLQIFKTVRNLSKQYSWREVIDALRPHTQQIWKKFSISEKKLFFRYLAALWNAHRHRTPAKVLEIVDFYQKEKRLNIVQGCVQNIEISHSKKVDAFVQGLNGESKTLSFDLLVNCSGPNYSIRKHENSLVQNLLQKGYIEPDEMGLGMNEKKSSFHGLGSLLFGTYFEITAVPEIRQQCRRLAAQLLIKENAC